MTSRQDVPHESVHATAEEEHTSQLAVNNSRSSEEFRPIFRRTVEQSSSDLASQSDEPNGMMIDLQEQRKSKRTFPTLGFRLVWNDAPNSGSQDAKRTYGKYEKVKTLGKGSFGTAVLLRHRRTGHLVVSKQVRVQEMPRAELSKVENEVRILSSLSHPHITMYHCSFQAEGNLNIVMEFASKGSVEEAIKERQASRVPFAEPTVIAWLQQLGGALQHMHLKQILHRDLKAANVFLTEDVFLTDGSIKLGDFGISKTLSTQTNLAVTACGTPFYFSPELINGKPYREPSDVWALGVLLFELLTLQRPFNGDNIASLAIAITNGKHDEEALERSPYAQWLRRLASKEKLLHLDPHKRLALPELLAAVGGLDGDGSEASLLALTSSLRGVPSLPPSIQEEDACPGRDGLHSPSKEKSGANEGHALSNSQCAGPSVLGAPMNAEERGASKEDHAATGEDLDDLDTVDGIDSVDAARMGKAAHVLARVAALERLGGVPAAQSPRLEEDRKLDECGTTGSV